MVKPKKYGYFDMVALAFATSPFYSLIFAAKYMADALIPVFSIFITANFINAALAVYGKSADISEVYMPLALLLGIMAYNTTSGTLMGFVECGRSIYFKKKLAPKILEKQAKLEYRHVENPETADLTERVCPKFPENVWDMYSQVLNAANLAVYIAGVLAALFTQVWWVSVFMFLSFVPIVYVSAKAGKRSYDAEREEAKIGRRMTYLSEVMKSREAVEERGIYGYTENLNLQYGEKFDYIRKFKLKVDSKNFVRCKTSGLVASLYSIVVMFAMLVPAKNGDIDLGMFIGLMTGVFGLTLTDRISWGFHRIVEDLVKKREYLKDLTDFTRLEEQKGALDPPEKNMGFQKIEFANVSFKYPGTDKPVLDGVSFILENGGHYSLVGSNGAGKSTIIKLLTGLYTNYEGEILVDGRPLRHFAHSEIKGLSSVVYQDFAKYHISLRDNIAVAGGDVGEAIELAGLSDAAKKLRHGIDTPLGKILSGGADLSGGEWQRVALARSIANDAPLKILDEPTAALDPVSECEVYGNFERISKGQTTIFISHRLGSTKLADTIYVLSDGKIVESGPHSELMEIKNGVYAGMFLSQAEWYRDKTGGEAAKHV